MTWKPSPIGLLIGIFAVAGACAKPGGTATSDFTVRRVEMPPDAVCFVFQDYQGNGPVGGISCFKVEAKQ